MDKPIVVVNANKAQCQELCAFLEREHYHVIALDSLVNLGRQIERTACRVIILDLDTLPVDNRFIKNLRIQNPGLPIMVLSSRPFHPELEEAMSSHICACLSKPPDLEELLYCVKSFCENESSSWDKPVGGT